MSEYQRYEFMTSDRPLTSAQLEEVNHLSSHIEASPTHALIEYHWGDFKHDPVKVTHKYFDGFLYFASWGSPRLVLRFPHGILPANLIEGYDFDEYVHFTRHPDFDILDIQYYEEDGPGEWVECELGDLISIREELMDGDLRTLYIAWLACQYLIDRKYGYDDEEEEESGEEEEQGNYETSAPPVPPDFGKLTAAQLALAKLLQVPKELLATVAQHGKSSAPVADDDIVTWVKLLPPDRCHDYLIRLAHNEQGLNRLFVRELRERNLSKASPLLSANERVPYTTLLIESEATKARLERESHEQQRQARQSHLQYVHDHRDELWQRVYQEVARGTSSGYDQGTMLLVDLCDAARVYQGEPAFSAQFSTWVRSQLRRPALLRRLRENGFIVPQ